MFATHGGGGGGGAGLRGASGSGRPASPSRAVAAATSTGRTPGARCRPRGRRPPGRPACRRSTGASRSGVRRCRPSRWCCRRRAAGAGAGVAGGGDRPCRRRLRVAAAWQRAAASRKREATARWPRRGMDGTAAGQRHRLLLVAWCRGSGSGPSGARRRAHGRFLVRRVDVPRMVPDVARRGGESYSNRTVGSNRHPRARTITVCFAQCLHRVPRSRRRGRLRDARSLQIVTVGPLGAFSGRASSSRRRRRSASRRGSGARTPWYG